MRHNRPHNLYFLCGFTGYVLPYPVNIFYDIFSTRHVDTAILLFNIVTPNAVEVTVTFPVETLPALTTTFLLVQTNDCRVALTPASHSASQPVGNGSGGSKKLNPVKLALPVNVI